MNSRISKLVLAVGVASTLGACATFPDLHLASSPPSADRLEQIHAGLTQDEVRDLAGGPASVSHPARSGALWTYSFTDDWGYEAEYDVTFDAGGVVTDAGAERIDR
jgi:outer membrane protein assembly factor BamE (lipoprotein component of BamABCDE complex)